MDNKWTEAAEANIVQTFAEMMEVHTDLWGRDTAVYARWLDPGWWVGLRTGNSQIPIGTTHFDVNILGRVVYILHIEVERYSRGMDRGKQLYRAIEEAARRLGCYEVRMTPSGWAWGGETRLDYCLRLGYERFDGPQVRKVL